LLILNPNYLMTNRSTDKTALIEIHGYSERHKADWTNYVEQSNCSTVCHQIGWHYILSKSLGHTPRYIIAINNGKLCGLLPLFLVKTWWNTRFLISIPWLDYGGIIADSEEIERMMIEYVRKLAEKEKVEFVELRSIESKTDLLSPRTDKVTFQLDLSPGEEAIWKNFGSKLRNQIRKAEKSGLRTEFGGTELLERFYAVFSHNMRDLGTPVWGKPLFERVLNTFENEARIVLVNRGEDTLAAGLLLSFKDHLYVPSASSYRSARNCCPNHALYWEVIRKGCLEGRKVFDFGRSTKDAPTFNFKKQWVPVPLQLVWQYQLHKATDIPTSDSQSSDINLMIDVWKKLPLPIANFLGPIVIKNFP